MAKAILSCGLQVHPPLLSSNTLECLRLPSSMSFPSKSADEDRNVFLQPIQTPLLLVTPTYSQGLNLVVSSPLDPKPRFPVVAPFAARHLDGTIQSLQL